MKEKRKIRRGDIYHADLRPAVGSEQNGIRPVLIVQNNMGNKFSPTVIVAAITSKRTKPNLPTHIPVGNVSGMLPDSIIMLEQIRTLDKSRLLHYIGSIEAKTMCLVNTALDISIGRG